MDFLLYAVLAVLILAMVAAAIATFYKAHKEDKTLSKHKEKSTISKSSANKSAIIALVVLPVFLWLLIARPFENVNTPIDFNFILAMIIGIVGFIVNNMITVRRYPVEIIRAKIASKYTSGRRGFRLYHIRFIIASNEILTFNDVKEELYKSFSIGNIVDLEYQGTYVRNITAVKERS